MPYTLLDRYDLTAELGRGGHAVVYRAHDRILHRDVAIKLLRDDVLSEDVLARFKQEVSVTARLEHAHILHVYDTGTHDGRPFVVMELAVGSTLGERMVREGPLPVDDALEITRALGLALTHAHSQGVIHRDVKPENVLLGPAGALLADFGVARVIGDAPGRPVTSTGIAVGSLQYMSPEQLCAEPVIDGRSDQYALACVLYEMLTGIRPHVAASVEGLRMLRITGQHVPITVHRASVPEHVELAVRRALSAVPGDRFARMEDFLAALAIGRESAEWARIRRTGEQDVVAGRMKTKSAAASTDDGAWWRGWRGVGAVVVLLGIVTVGGAQLRSRSASRTDSLRVSRGGAGVELDALARALYLAPSIAGDAGDAALTDSLNRALRAELIAWPALTLLTREEGAPRSVRATVQRVGDSVRVVLDVQSPEDGAGRRVVRTVAASAMGGEFALRQFAHDMLSREPADSLPGIQTLHERSLNALAAYGAGWQAIRAGQLDDAEQHFNRAVREAPAFAAASLWAAQAGAWRAPRNGRAWGGWATSALQSIRLDSAAHAHAAALSALATADFPSACSAYREAIRLDGRQFATRFGLGECQRLDSVVVGTGGRARFRSSYWSALVAYEEAIGVSPPSALLDVLFGRVMTASGATGSSQRTGRSDIAPRFSYAALPSVEGDTLQHIPILRDSSETMGARSIPATYSRALRLGRARAVALSAQWVRHSTAAVAWRQYALALELFGDGSVATGERITAEGALDRALKGDSSDVNKSLIALARARLALRQGDFAAAVLVARPAVKLAESRLPESDATIQPLAALLGELRVAEGWDAGVSSNDLPQALGDSLNRFLALVALGDCGRVRERVPDLELMFSTLLSRNELGMVREQVLRQAYLDATPCLGVGATRDFVPHHAMEYVMHDLAAGRSQDARKRIEAIRKQRSGATLSSLSWDYLFLEAWALAKAGDTVTAAATITTALDDLRSTSLFTLSHLPQAAGLRKSLWLLRQIANSPSSQHDARQAERTSRWIAKSATLFPNNEEIHR